MSKISKKTKVFTDEPLSKDQINAMVSDCGHEKGAVHFRSSCHRSSPTWCSYNREGFLTIACSKCESEVVKIAVAAGEVKIPMNLECHS